MKLTPSQKETVRHEFDSYCKKVLRGEASDYDDHLSWRSKYETTLSGLSEKQMGTLSVPDEYSCEQFRFQVQGYSIEVEDVSTNTNETETAENEVGVATFEEIYKAYEENELVADDLYKNNRYSVTAKINGMTNDGLLNLTGGATLTMEKQVGDTIVFFYAEFEKEQEENLKTVKVGDTITFTGECLSAGAWVDCELILEG